MWLVGSSLGVHSKLGISEGSLVAMVGYATLWVMKTFINFEIYMIFNGVTNKILSIVPSTTIWHVWVGVIL